MTQSSSGPTSPQPRRRVVELLSELYRQKILFASTVVIAIALVLFTLEAWLVGDTHDGWVSHVPFRSVADALLIAGIVGVAFEWMVRKEAEEKLGEVVRNELERGQASVEQRLLALMLGDPVALSRRASSSERASVIRAALQAEVGDSEVGSQLYDAVVSRTLGFRERWTNYRCSATLRDIRDTAVDAATRRDYYHCYYDLRYDTVLTRTSLVFACVHTIESFNEHLVNPDCEMCWLFPIADARAHASTSGFRVVNVTVGGEPLDVVAESAPGVVRYTATQSRLASKVGQTVTVQYRVDVHVLKVGHLLSLSLVYPTRGVLMELDVTDTDIAYVSARDYFPSGRSPNMRYLPDAANAKKISVEVADWVLPKAGVDFVWVRRDERALPGVALTASEEPGAASPR